MPSQKTPAKAANAAKPAPAPKPPKAAARKAKPAGAAAKTPPKAADAVTPNGVAPAAKSAAGKTKHKLIRDSFTIPKVEYAVLELLKLRAVNLKRPVKKSELLRAGISALQAMADKDFLRALNNVPTLKTGRPLAAPAEPAGPAKKRAG